MIVQSSGDVIIHLNFTPAKVRFAGIERSVLQASTHGFCVAEFDDGDNHPISHPLEDWFLSIRNLSNGGLQNVYFIIDAPGDRSNDGGDDATGSVNNLQTTF